MTEKWPPIMGCLPIHCQIPVIYFTTPNYTYIIILETTCTLRTFLQSQEYRRNMNSVWVWYAWCHSAATKIPISSLHLNLHISVRATQWCMHILSTYSVHVHVHALMQFQFPSIPTYTTVTSAQMTERCIWNARSSTCTYMDKGVVVYTRKRKNIRECRRLSHA